VEPSRQEVEVAPGLSKRRYANAATATHDGQRQAVVVPGRFVGEKQLHLNPTEIDASLLAASIPEAGVGENPCPKYAHQRLVFNDQDRCGVGR
jgi:hypothetical protein